MGLKPFSYFANLAIEVMSNRCPGTELIMAANLISMYSKKTKLPLMTRHLTGKLTENGSRWFFCKFT